MSESIQEILDTPSDVGADVTSSLDVAPEPETGLSGDSVAEAVAAVEAASDGTADGAELEATEEGETTEEGEAKEEEEGAELYRVKVDGNEFEVDLDELKAGYSRGRASTKRFQEAAALQKSVQGFVGELKKGDPHMIEQLFSKIGLDFQGIAEQYLTGKLEELQMPEAQRGMRELERQRAMLERERQAFQSQTREAQIQRESEVILQQLQTETERALRAQGFEPSRALFAQAAHLMEQSISAGYQMTPDEAVTNIRESLMALPRDALARVVGGDKANEMRREAGQAAESARKKAPPKAPGTGKRDASEVPFVSTNNMDDVRRLFDM